MATNPVTPAPGPLPPQPTLEPYFTVLEIAELWKCAPLHVTALFENEARVLDLAKPGGRRRMLRIPLSVFERVADARAIQPFRIELKPRRGGVK